LANKAQTKAPLAKQTKKPIEKAEKKETVKKPNWLQARYRETTGELRRVTWPTRREALNMTGIVLLVLFVMAIFLGLVDFAAARLISLIIF
jgi:preprotein translocase subunit SecE